MSLLDLFTTLHKIINTLVFLKQQVKQLSKKEFKNLKYLCHIAKNLKNQTIYNVRQYYFKNKNYLSYNENYKVRTIRS